MHIRENAKRAQIEASMQLVELIKKVREKEVEKVGMEGEDRMSVIRKEMKMLSGTKRKQTTNRNEMTRVRKTIEGDIKEAMIRMKGKESEVEEELSSRYEANVKQRRRSTQESHELYRGLSELLGGVGENER